MNNKEFNEILDKCLQRLLEGEDLEQCLRDYPDQADQIRPLLQTAAMVKTTTTLQPRPEFMSHARHEFQMAVRNSQSKKAHRWFIWRPVWAGAVSTVVVCLLAGGATVMASGNSMPDQTLYPVKVAAEQVRLTLTRSPIAKATLNAELADKRVNEIVYLANKGEAEDAELESVTTRLQQHMNDITTFASATNVAGAQTKFGALQAPSVQSVAPSSGGETPQPAVTPAPTSTEPGLGAGGPGKNDDNMTTAAASPRILVDAESNARDLAQKLREAKTDQEKLKITLANYAQMHPAELREALKKAPDAIKPILRQAIAISEEGYQQANKALD